MNKIIITSLVCLIFSSFSAAQCPIAYYVTGGGTVCTGQNPSAIGMSQSQNGYTYRLYRSGNLIDLRTGTGFPFSFTLVTTAGTYNVQATSPGGCTVGMQNTVTIAYVNPGSLTITPSIQPPTICAGSGITLTAGGGSNYSWTANTGGSWSGSPITVYPTSTTTYTLNGNESNCNQPASANIQVTVTPTVSQVSTPTGTASRCQGSGSDTYSASASNASGGYSWSITPAAGNITSGGVVTWNSSFSGTATISVTAYGCNSSSTSASTNVTVYAPPAALNIGANSTSLCSGATTTVTIPGTQNGVSYQLYKDAAVDGSPQSGNGSTLSWSGRGIGTYYAVATGPSCSSVNTANSVVINLLSPGTLSISPSITPSICAGTSITLTASGGSNYSWTSSESGSWSGNAITVSPTVTTTYTLNGNESNCNQPRSVNLQVSVTPTVSQVSAPSGIVGRCQGSGSDTYTASASNASGGYSWSITPAAGSINSGGVVTWNSGFSGTATITVTAYGCNSSSTTANTNVIVSAPPLALNIGANSTSLCSGATTTVTIPGTQTGISYQLYKDGAIDGSPQSGNGSTLSWTGRSVGTYYAVATGPNCSSVNTANSVVINLLSPGTLAITPSITPPTICAGTPITLTASGGSNYSWTSSESGSWSGSPIVVTPNVTTTYTLSGNESVCGQPRTANIVVTVKPVPNVDAAPSSQSICNGQAMTAINLTNPNGVSGTTFSWTVSAPNITGASAWSGTSINQTLSQSTNVNQTATYTITPTANGCSGTPVAATVTIKPVPNASVSLPTQTICSGAAMTNVTISNPNVVSGTTFAYTVSAPNISGASGGSTNPINQTLTNSTNTNQTATYTITPTASGCNGSAIAASVTLKPLPSVAVSIPTQSICSGNSMTSISISNPNSVAGTTFSYSVSAPNITGASGGPGASISQSLSQTTAINQTATYTAIATSNGCSGSSVNSTVIVKPIPTLSSSLNPDPITSGSSFNYTPTSAVSNPTFNWSRPAVTGIQEVSSFGTGAISETLTNITESEITVNYLFSSSADGCTISTQVVAVLVTPLISEENFIATSILLVPQTDLNAVDLMPVTDRSLSIEYFDGLGRPMQTVSWQNSPTAQDLVQPIVYDEYGRVVRKYLPFAAQNDGKFKPTTQIIDQAGNYTGIAQPFYNNISGKIAVDSRPYQDIAFEPSPLNRPISELGAGADWQSNFKYVQFNYLVNAHGTGAGQEKIIAWMINTSNVPVRSTPLIAGYTVTGGYYASNQLSVKSIRDEHGHEIREYTDKSGRLILKKVQYVSNPTLSNRDHWAQTYYVYDDLGNLRFVLPPELSYLIHLNDTKNPSTTELNNWAFQYSYDTRNRMISKKVPGADIVYMVYDNRDRLILTQDAVQRATSPYKWTFTKYDELNRPILTGIKDTTANVSQSVMQGAVNAHFAKTSARWSETYVGNIAGNVHGYSNKAYPIVTTASIVDVDQYLTVTYYDDYSFKALLGSPQFDYQPSEVTGQVVLDDVNDWVVGQVTGGKTRMISTATWLKSVNYYDDKYRLIQSIADNTKGHEINTQVYDFVGKVLRRKTSLHIGQPIQWTGITNASVSGDALTGTSSTNWAAGAVSLQTLAAGLDGWAEFRVTKTSPRVTVGLSDQNTNTNFNTIDYAWDINGNTLRPYENGTARSTATVVFPGDILRVERINNIIYYKRNGVVHYKSLVTSTTLLMADASLYNNGSTISQVRLSPTFTPFTSTPQTIAHRFTYDHAGRLLQTWHSLNGAAEILLSMNRYNELGQLVDKELHSTNGTQFRQNVDYRYNIRGWLTRINNSDLEIEEGETKDYFGMELFYNAGAGTSNSPQYNGNISAATWSFSQGLGTVKEQGYNFSYDPLNRLLAASHLQSALPGIWSAGQYDESGITYDFNGNISTLQRKGENGVQIDNLTYNYGSTRTNRLLSVTDNTANATDKLKGFKDGNTSGNDFTYDVNGNMLRDLNKGITTNISYNHLNLPEVVTRSTGNVRYLYDAAGVKRGQVVTQGNSQKLTEYVGSWVFENGEPQFIQHEEGRIVLANPTEIYTHTFDDASNITPTTGVTLLSETINGEKYLKVTGASGSSLSSKGITPIGGTFPVAPGDRYKLRVKGYRNAQSVNLFVKGVSNIVWPGANLPGTPVNEGWTETTFIVPAGVTSITVGVLWNSTSTAGDYFYLNDLELIKVNTSVPEYQYHLKDHLGNVRLTFTSKDETDSNTASLETANLPAEQGQFLRIENAKRINSSLFDRTNGVAPTTTTGYAQRLNGSANEKYGLAKSLSVMPGDVINAEVYAKYVDPNSSNWTGALATLMSQIAANTAGVVIDGATYTTSTASFPAGFGTLQGTTDNGAPRAYLNWLVFDRNYVFITGGFKQITTVAKETGTDIAHERIFNTSPITITQPGYVYIYLSNESTTPVEVFFDEFKVTHTKSPVIQQDDYYPFGLTYNSFTRENSLQNEVRFQGQENVDDLGLNWDSFKWRNHQSDIGRFFNVDPLTDKYVYNSPYAFSENRVVNGRELEGLEWVQSISDNAVTFTVTLKVANTANISPEALKTNMTNISKQIQESFKGKSVDGKLTYNTKVVVDFKSKVDPEKDFYVDFVKEVEGGSAGSVGLVDREGDTQINRIQVQVAPPNHPEDRTDQEIARTGAHETGHTGGLSHAVDGDKDKTGVVLEPDNLMRQSQQTSGTVVNSQQLDKLHKNVKDQTKSN